MGTKKGRKHFGELIIEDVLKLKSQGCTNREISEKFGLESKAIIVQLVKRYNCKQRAIEAGVSPRKRGRPRKNETDSFEDKDREIEKLRMEVELLRAFLYEAERWNARI